jgi:hypothetical protein
MGTEMRHREIEGNGMLFFDGISSIVQDADMFQLLLRAKINASSVCYRSK